MKNKFLTTALFVCLTATGAMVAASTAPANAGNRWGERVNAFKELRDNGSVTAKDWRRAAGGDVAKQKEIGDKVSAQCGCKGSMDPGHD